MLINIGIFYFVFLHLFNLKGVLSDDGKEHSKSSLVISEPHFQFTVSEHKLTWKDAKMACKKEGMEFAVLDTDEKQRELTRFFTIERDNLDHSLTTDYWVGSSRIATDFSMFRWESGRFVDLRHWVDGIPNLISDKYCLGVRVIADMLKWHDIECDKLNKYICMYKISEEEAKHNGHMVEIQEEPGTNQEHNKNVEPESRRQIPFGRPIMFNPPNIRMWRHSYRLADDPMYNYDDMMFRQCC